MKIHEARRISTTTEICWSINIKKSGRVGKRAKKLLLRWLGHQDLTEKDFQ